LASTDHLLAVTSKRSPRRSECFSSHDARDIAGIRSLNVRELERQRICTMAGLAATGGVLPEAPRRGARETYTRLGLS